MDEPNGRQGHPELITEAELMEWAGTKQQAKLVRWLGSNGIRFHFNHKRRVCTTVTAVNASLLGTEDNEPVEFNFD